MEKAREMEIEMGMRHMGSVAKFIYMRNGFLIHEKMCNYFSIYEEAVNHL